MKPKRNKSARTTALPGPVVLDASAMLAVLRRERGADVVVPHLRGAKISTVNCAEVLQKSSEIGASDKALLQIMDELEIGVVDFNLEHATVCASLLQPTRSLGLSLGDRACLALGMLEDALVLTADRDWDDPVITARMKFIR